MGRKKSSNRRLKTNTRSGISVRQSNGKPAGSRKYNGRKALAHEFKHDIIGRASCLGIENRKQTMRHVDIVCEYMQRKESLNSIRSMGPEHYARLASHLQNEYISAKTRTNLDVSTVYDIMGTAAWMYKAATGSEPPSRSDLGVFKRRSDTQNPIDFQKVAPDYKDQREEISADIAGHYPCLATADRLGQAFGLRHDERVGTRGDVITRVNGQLMATYKGGTLKPVTRAMISRRYSDPSYWTNTRHIKEGKEYLIVEWAKGRLGRYSEIYNEERRAAIEAHRAYIKAHGEWHGTCLPSIHPHTGAAMNRKTAEDLISNAMQHAKERLRLMPKDVGSEKSYVFTCNGDRHYDVQRQVADGRTDAQIIVEKGHFDKDKLNFYRRK